jgi:hypothetical protein
MQQQPHFPQQSTQSESYHSAHSQFLSQPQAAPTFQDVSYNFPPQGQVHPRQPSIAHPPHFPSSSSGIENVYSWAPNFSNLNQQPSNHQTTYPQTSYGESLPEFSSFTEFMVPQNLLPSANLFNTYSIPQERTGSLSQEQQSQLMDTLESDDFENYLDEAMGEFWRGGGTTPTAAMGQMQQQQQQQQIQPGQMPQTQR